MSETTMGIYMRALRALYNYAQDKFNLPREEYPFGKNKIVIHTSESSHRAMPDEDFNKFINYKPANKNEEFAHDMFFISFGLAGMNTADILNLKNKNIKSNHELEYVREKTKDRTTKRTAIKMVIPTKVMSLINKYAVLHSEEPEEYIFPFYTNTMTEKQKLRKRKDINRRIDWSLKDICANLDILPITTYWARHTIATKLYNTGESPAVISKLLGHSSIKTTDTYLGQLGLDKKEEVATNVSNLLADYQHNKMHRM
jgi:integrase